MTKAKPVKSIKCTQCGAPLQLFGGHRIETITCSYCGAVLDNKNEYKVLKKFVNTKRPAIPFAIGAQATLKGITFTTIGFLQYTNTTEYYSWIEYLLFSPTHGYAWLECEDGHFILSRKVRDNPEGRILTYRKSRIRVRDQDFKVFETYGAELTYVEGELTWEAQRGDKLSFIDAINPPYIFCIEKNRKEQEYSLGEYLNYAEVYRGFSIKPPMRGPSGIHAAQPYTPNALVRGLHSAGKYFAPIALVIFLLVLFIGSGEVVMSQNFYPDQYLSQTGELSKSFSINQAQRLVRLDLYSDLNNAWGWYDIEILKDNIPIYSLGKQISYYHGYSGGESWSEGSRSVHAYLKVPQNGVYSLRITGEGGMGEYGKTPQRRKLFISVKEGVIVSRYFLILFIFSLLSWLLIYMRKLLFEAARWKDDDDD